MLTTAGAAGVTAPRVSDRRVDPDTVERQRFSSATLPAWARKSPQMSEVLPLLYLHGLSTSDFGPALERFLGSGAGLSATTITRRTSQWQDEPSRSANAISRAPMTCTCGSMAIYLEVRHYRIRSLLHCGNRAQRIDALYLRKSRCTADSRRGAR